MSQAEIAASDNSEQGRRGREFLIKALVDNYRVKERFSSNQKERMDAKQQADRLEDLHEAALLRDQYAEAFDLYDITDEKLRISTAANIDELSTDTVKRNRLIKNINY